MDTKQAIHSSERTLHSRNWVLWSVLAFAGMAILFAAALVPTDPEFVGLEGVLGGILVSSVSCVAFFRCPSRPMWKKGLTLLFAVPVWAMTVYGVLTFTMFRVILPRLR